MIYKIDRNTPFLNNGKTICLAIMLILWKRNSALWKITWSLRNNLEKNINPLSLWGTMERLAMHCSQLYQSGCVIWPSQNYGRDSQLVQPPIILIVFNVYFTNVFDFEQENNCPILYVLFQIWHDPSVIRNQESLVICIY